MNETDDGRRFARLREKSGRRSGPSDVASAPSEGRIDAEGRAALAVELGALVETGRFVDARLWEAITG